MRILYFMNHVGKGGAALALVDLVKELRNNYSDIDPIVVTGRYNELNKVLNKIGIENFSSTYKNFLSSYKKPSFFWKTVLQFRYRLLKPIAIKKIENIIDFRTIEIIHSNLNRIDIGYYFAKKYSIPHVWHIREHGERDFLMPVFSTYFPLLEDTTSHFVAISNSVKSFWVSRGLPEHNTRVIYDGIDTEYWSKNIVFPKFTKLSFIFLGGYHVNKGQEIFLKALTLLPKQIKNDIIVHFWGDGSKILRQKLIRLVKENNLNNCCAINDYDPDIHKKLSRYHIGVNCSKSEGFGRATVEYMMAGLCPLVSKGSANVEIVEDNKTGIMFDRDNLYDIKEKIIYLYNNSDIIKSISKNAKEKAFSCFSMKVHTQMIHDLYKQILN